jgi:hypothetical protein
MSKYIRFLISVAVGIGILLALTFIVSLRVQASDEMEENEPPEYYTHGNSYASLMIDDGTGERGAPVAPQAEYSTGAVFTVTPQVSTVGAGQVFTVLLQIDNVTMTVKAWQVALKYDPSVVTMINFTPGNFFAGSCTLQAPSSQWQPTEGEMQFGVLCMSGDSGGKTGGTLATLNMSAQFGAAGQSSGLNFDIDDVVITKLSVGNYDYYKPLATNLYNGMVNVLDSGWARLLVGEIAVNSFQTVDGVTLTVKFDNEETQVVVDASGTFTVTTDDIGIPFPQTYTVCVKELRTLAECYADPVAVPAAAPVVFDNLYVGDTNGDNTINMIDFSVWAGIFNGGFPIYDKRGDFNNDATINMIDFSIWAGAFNGGNPPPGDAW